MEPIKMTSKQIMSFEFSNLMQKVVNTPTANKNASHIHKIYKELERNSNAIRESFKKDIMEVYATKDEAGKVKLDEHGHYSPDASNI